MIIENKESNRNPLRVCFMAIYQTTIKEKGNYNIFRACTESPSPFLLPQTT